MASTEAGAALTEQYRRRQLALRSATISDLLEIWPAFSIDDIDRSWPPVEAGIISLVAARRQVSAGLAADYFGAYRTAEGARGSAAPRLADPPPRDLQQGTLRLLGPIATKRSIERGVSAPEALALTRIAGSVSRQVLNGGRDTLTASTRADNAAQGWRRITDFDPCKFCAGIAAQGIVGLDVDFPAHDHCGCTQEVAY